MEFKIKQCWNQKKNVKVPREITMESSLGDHHQVMRYSDKVSESLYVIRSGFNQRPHDILNINQISVEVIITFVILSRGYELLVLIMLPNYCFIQKHKALEKLFILRGDLFKDSWDKPRSRREIQYWLP